ncbi:MAG: VCBS repeat-containing protein [Planctomycetes bacterium]|nr:VCBS repeat-containing protein [Planctomycetota bacterium]
MSSPRGVRAALAAATLGAAVLVGHAPGQVAFQHEIIDAQQSGDCKGIGDFDGDGLVDVVQGGAQLVLYIWPTWSQVLVDVAHQEFTTDMAVGDVDGDGDVDLVIPDGNSGENLLWYENPRPGGSALDGSAWVRHAIGAQGGWVHDVVTGDLDGDGRLDVVGRKGTTAIYSQHTPGVFTHTVLTAASTQGEGTDVGDIDGDGDLDLAFNAYWVEQTSTGWAKHAVASGWPTQVGVTLADLQLDGRTDVLLSPAEAVGQLAWYEAADPVHGPWTEHVIDGNVTGIHTFKTADIDLDGRLDVVTAEMFGDVVVHYNQGDGLAWTHQLVGTGGSHNLRLGDLAGDGDTDIVGANFIGNAPLETWENGVDPSGRAVDLGHALAGSLGSPSLTATSFQPGDEVAYTVAGALPNAPAVFVFGLQKIDVPFHGGLFVPDTTLLVPQVVGSHGAFGLTLGWPAGMPFGFTLTAQVWVKDAGAPLGFSSTNAVDCTVF